MRFFDAPQLDAQRKPLEPHKMISGNLPGATQIRVGGDENVLIDGLNKRISVTSDGGTISIGRTPTGDLQLVVNDGTTNVIRAGDLGSDFIGLAFNDSNDDRIFVGKDADDNYVAKLSQSGNDAKTADDDQLIWSSEFNNFKIVGAPVEISLSVTTAGSGAFNSTSKAHGLSFTPSYLAFINIDPDIAAFAASPAENIANPALTYALVGGVIQFISVSIISVDSTNVTLSTQLSNIVTSGTYDFSAKVYLLRETFG